MNGNALFKVFIVMLLCRPAADAQAAVGRWEAADSITVVITDSGLGGLSVVADLENKLRESRAFAGVDIIFFNALFSADSGYNSLPSREDKILMFDRALKAMRERHRPDIILIACNTLSVLYRNTPFAAEVSIPVIDIVHGGVELIAASLSEDPTGKVIIFGTETTIGENSHMAALVARGIQMDRVVTQSCPQLAAYIEQDADGTATNMLVDAYVSDALAKAGDSKANIYVSLNCTHYGYALDAWCRAFTDHGVTVSGFLNPNSTLADRVLDLVQAGRFPTVRMRIRVVSMIEIPDAMISSIGGCLERLSPATVDALRHYELHPDLFQWQDLCPADRVGD
jgi:glutamate racemase